MGLSSEAQSCPATGCVPMLGGGCGARARALPPVCGQWAHPVLQWAGLGGSKEQAGSAPRGLPLPPCCTQRHRPEARTAGQAWPSSLKRLCCVALGPAPRLLDSSVSSRNTTLSRGGPQGRVRLDSAWWVSSRAQATSHSLPSPQECPLAKGTETEEGCRGSGAGSSAARTWGSPGPDLGEGGGGLTAWAQGELQTPISLPASAPPPGSFQKGRESLGRGAGVGAERGLEAEHPNVQGPGPCARRGRHPGGRGPPCSSWCPTLVSHQLFFSGCPECSLPPGGGRPGGQAHCTRTGGWTCMHKSVCVCVCVCAPPPPVGQAGWGPWALGHRPLHHVVLLMPGSGPRGGVGPSLPHGGSGSAEGDRSLAGGHMGGGPGPGLHGGHPRLLAQMEGA